MSGQSPRLSIIIPTLDESGGSSDHTVDIASAVGARVVQSPPGRGGQLRAGVRASHAPWLLVMHADSRLPSPARDAVADFLRDALDDDFAHFEFALGGDGPFWRLIEFGQRLRERMYGLVYGDQGLLVSRALYDAVGGYEHWPVMEDIGLFDRLKRAGNGCRLGTPVLTSPRRYEERGRWSQWLANLGLISLFRLGVDPHRLARWYPTQRAPSSPTHVGQTIILFAKAPRLGFVKTRLARDIGEERALHIYRALGFRAAEVARRTQRRVIIYFTPDDAEAEIRDWLGDAGLEFRPQGDGDLGKRMARAFEACLPDCAAVCIVGTDIPGITPSTLGDAFDALTARDVVLGPAEDGGYYLVGLSEPRPELFDDVPWSTEAVFDVTTQRAKAEGLSVAVIDPLADVDTVGDVPAGLSAGSGRRVRE